MTSKSQIIKIDSLSEINIAANKFIQTIGNNKIIAFKGEMGVGKTTFIKEICKILNVKDNVNSPTFSIVNEYHTADNNIIFHFDFYRIETLKEVYDFGIDDYLYSNNLCLIEWPEKVESMLPSNTLFVSIIENEKMERIIEFEK